MSDRYGRLNAEWWSVFDQHLEADDQYIEHKREDGRRELRRAEILRRLNVHLERMGELRRQMKELRQGEG